MSKIYAHRFSRVSSTFVDDVLAGRAAMADIDDYIDRWHDAPEGSPIAVTELHDYLGMSWEEYRLWGERPESLRFILSARRAELPVTEVLRQDLIVGAAARSKESSVAHRVLAWLAERGRIEARPHDI